MGSSSPLLSIILPNYNHAPYLPQRLQSIYHQTYPNVEVILLDDHSTDHSLNLLEKYRKHPKTAHFIVNQQNSGSTFIQWKKGIELAKGKYIWIAESDDWAELDFLEKLVPVLEADEQIALAYCQSKKVDENGKVVNDMLYYTYEAKPNKWESAYTNTGNQEIEQHLVYKNTIPNASAVVFRNTAGIANWVNTEMTMVGDWWFWVHLIKDQKIAFLPERLNYFRAHPASTRADLRLPRQIENTTEKLQLLRAIQHHFPHLEKTIQIVHQRMIAELFLASSIRDYPQVSNFVQRHFNSAPSFATALVKAHWQWVKNKWLGLRRSIYTLKYTSS
ncbi:MAG: glycosyltransferase family 2 protein [Bacteroidota bacterium]